MLRRALDEMGHAFLIAADQVIRLDPELIGIVLLSLRVSLTATVVAFALGTPLGAWLAMTRLPGRTGLLVLVNAALGLPPVVVGLVIYLALSRSGPLGPLGLLFTPGAMIIAQGALALPIVIALTHRALEGPWAEFGDALVVDGASGPGAMVALLAMGRAGLVTVFLSAFGRVIAEVGAILVVGGNIRGYTRTMTTAVALDTSTGDFPLALSLGLILICTSIGVSTAAFAIHRLTDRR